LRLPGDITEHHRIQFLRATEVVLPEVLVDLFRNVYPFRNDEPHLNAAIEAWAESHLLTAKYTNEHFASWMKRQVENTLIWWGRGRATGVALFKGELGSNPVSESSLQWSETTVRVLKGGPLMDTVSNSPAPDPYELNFNESWNPLYGESLEATRSQMRRNFDKLLNRRLPESQATARKEFGVIPATEKFSPIHYEWVALNKIRPEKNDCEALASRYNSTENTVKKTIAATAFLIGMNRRPGRPRH
jgi:hypothetical protein